MDARYIFEYLLKPKFAQVTVTAILDLLRIIRREPQEWEYVPKGWLTQDERIKGWNEQSIVETQKIRRPTFMHSLEGTHPLGLAEAAIRPTNDDWRGHNTLICYAYALALAARKKDSLAILDWGSGAGHYYLISKALLPEIPIEYHCYDVPLLCQLGRKLLPEVNFYENSDDVLQRRYDLVLSSGSLQYSENWPEIVRKVAAVTRGFLYIARLPIVHEVPSFVVVQRPYKCGYRTEYLGWFLNRGELLKCAEEAGMELIREFLIAEKPFVPRAPEQAESRGFLFRRQHKWE